MVVFVVLFGTWFIYVPVHEFLHVAGCLLSGGSITRLEISPIYGGALLARVFPFVAAGGEYAGRLSGFDIKGSDLVYLATDAMPFVLSIVLGVPMIRWCARRSRPVVFGAACVVGLAPFYNIFGDYYEMGSIMVTRALAEATGQPIEFSYADPPPPAGDAAGAAGGEFRETGSPEPMANSPVWTRLRGDDVFERAAAVIRRPAELGVNGVAPAAMAMTVIALSFVVGVLLAFVTYYLGHLLARSVGLYTPDSPSRE